MHWKYCNLIPTLQPARLHFRITTRLFPSNCSTVFTRVFWSGMTRPSQLSVLFLPDHLWSRSLQPALTVYLVIVRWARYILFRTPRPRFCVVMRKQKLYFYALRSFRFKHHSISCNRAIVWFKNVMRHKLGDWEKRVRSWLHLRAAALAKVDAYTQKRCHLCRFVFTFFFLFSSAAGTSAVWPAQTTVTVSSVNELGRYTASVWKHQRLGS